MSVVDVNVIKFVYQKATLKLGHRLSPLLLQVLPVLASCSEGRNSVVMVM